MPEKAEVLSCKYCNDTFQRKGHLQRHMLRHSGMKPFSCGTCSKSFSRRDTLLRHEAIHDQDQSQQSHSRKALQACLPCAQAKQRCDGKLSCARCERKGFHCEYNNEPRRGLGPAVSRTKNTRSNEALFSSDEYQGCTSTSATLPTASVSTTPVSQGPGALAAQPSIPLAAPTTSNNSLSDEMHRLGWLDHVFSADSASAEEYDLFTDFCLPDSVPTDEARFDPSLPSRWTIQDLECPTETLCSLRTSDRGSIAALETTERAISNTFAADTHPALEVAVPQSHNTSGTTLPPTLDDFLAFPTLLYDDVQCASVEIFGHVSQISSKAYEALHAFYVAERGYDDLLFPDCQLLTAFVDLYLEHFDPHLPFLHQTKMESEDLSWVLLTAVAAIGGQYSEVKDASRITAVLRTLLQRATNSKPCQLSSKPPDISLVQSVLLRDIGSMFSGTPLNQTVLQHEKSLLVTLCRSLITPDVFSKPAEPTVQQNSDHEWRAWLEDEEMVRLMHSVYTLECFQLVFLDLRPSFKLTELTQRLPCNDSAWRCRDAKRWRELDQKQGGSVSQRRHESLLCRTGILSLYAAERDILDHMQSSRLLQSLIRSESRSDAQAKDTYSIRRTLLSLGAFEDDVKVLDTIIDDNMVPRLSSGPELAHGGHDPIIHVVAIQREIPLRIIYSSVGWQVDSAEMERCRARLRIHLRRNLGTARSCLWHAAQIYSLSRNLRFTACHFSLSLCIAVTYIFLYDQIVQLPSPQGELILLDKLVQKSQVDAWVESVDDSRVHITGIGILDNYESSRRLLLDAEAVLRSQKSWQTFAEALARTFAQMSQGQQPHI
ncbi:hypothetical protein CDEST_13845 [Colletotrichum destructivum]|uniref:pH-response transcription factor pacC/RIM101 n=1 Tax=Colletotrichum destructivum TaxID=34406 RepID=A0AAX4J060_9PEZI|nr:hypothetical protein CDEST_13845 [Colletotrichum destructivum]